MRLLPGFLVKLWESFKPEPQRMAWVARTAGSPILVAAAGERRLHGGQRAVGEDREMNWGKKGRAEPAKIPSIKILWRIPQIYAP